MLIDTSIERGRESRLRFVVALLVEALREEWPSLAFWTLIATIGFVMLIASGDAAGFMSEGF